MAASRKPPPAESLREHLAAFIAQRVPDPDPLCIGLSGGCDSLVLTHLLAGIVPTGRLAAVHVHHGLSPRADEWASFCLDFCARLGVSCRVERVEVPRQSGSGLEAAARRERYAIFARQAAKYILLAHHQGDQAETVLFNLLRGSGLAGLAGMPAARGLADKVILRPLLDISRAQLEDYARAQDLPWINDESNDDWRYTRNFLRHAVLPIVEQRFPAARSQLAQAAALCAEAQDVLDEVAEADWCTVADGDRLRLADFRALSPARGRHLIRHRLRCLGWRVPSRQRLEEFVRQLHAAAVDRHPELVLPDGIMRAGRGFLVWLPAADEINKLLPGDYSR